MIIKISLKHLKWCPPFRRMLEFTLHQTVHRHVARETQNIQSSDWLKWHCVFCCFVLSSLLLDQMSIHQLFIPVGLGKVKALNTGRVPAYFLLKQLRIEVQIPGVKGQSWIVVDTVCMHNLTPNDYCAETKINKRAQRALGRSPEEKVKGHSGAIYRGSLLLSTKYG